jgi:AcrR family transcriptional regulator
MNERSFIMLHLIAMTSAQTSKPRLPSAQASGVKAAAKPRRASPRPLFDPDRRQAVLAAALEMFSQKGFDRTTIRDIAKQAQLAEGTIYNHFENKTALMEALLESLASQGQAKVDMSLPDDLDLAAFLPEHLRMMLDLLIGQAGKALPVILAELLVNTELREAHVKKIGQSQREMGVQTLKQFEKRKLIRKNNPELTVRMISALIMGISLQRQLGDEYLTKYWAQVPDAMAQLLLQGLQPAQSIRN